MCQVRSFLCGCTLRQGAITAAVLTAIASVIYLIQGITLFVRASHYKSNIAKEYRIQGGFSLFNFFLCLAVFICLFFAIRKNRSGLVIPWLVCVMISIIILVINVILYLVSGYWAGLIVLILLAIFIYLWIVVFSFYKELQAGGSTIPKV